MNSVKATEVYILNQVAFTSCKFLKNLPLIFYAPLTIFPSDLVEVSGWKGALTYLSGSVYGKPLVTLLILEPLFLMLFQHLLKPRQGYTISGYIVLFWINNSLSVL